MLWTTQRATLFLRYTNDVSIDLAHPYSREYTTLATIAPEDTWDDITLSPGQAVRVWKPTFGEGNWIERVVFDGPREADEPIISDGGVFALKQPGLCGVPCQRLPDNFVEACENAYYLGRTSRWAKYLVAYEGVRVGAGYDSTLFRPTAVARVWDVTSALLEPTLQQLGSGWKVATLQSRAAIEAGPDDGWQSLD